MSTMTREPGIRGFFSMAGGPFQRTFQTFSMTRGFFYMSSIARRCFKGLLWLQNFFCRLLCLEEFFYRFFMPRGPFTIFPWVTDYSSFHTSSVARGPFTNSILEVFNVQRTFQKFSMTRGLFYMYSMAIELFRRLLCLEKCIQVS